MKVENRVNPEPEQVREFLKSGDRPVVMVNLLKFREKAAYADGRDPDISGREAYMRYGVEMKKLVEAAGGRFVFGGEVAGLLLGEVGELWDHVGLVEYPSPASLVEIASSPAFHEIEVHRVAGLAGQLNLTVDEIPFA